MKIKYQNFYDLLQTWIIPILTVVFIAYQILNYYYVKTDQPDETLQIAINFLLALLATGAGIYIPFRANRKNQEAINKRKLKFMLNAIADEILDNQQILDNLYQNSYTDTQSLNTLFQNVKNDLPESIHAIYIKTNSLSSNINALSWIAFNNLNSTLTITYLSEDDLYNILVNYYADIRWIKYTYEQFCAGLKMRVEVTKIYQLDTLDQTEKQKLINKIESDINKLNKYIKASQSMTTELNEIIHEELIKFGINRNEIIPKS